VNAKNKPIPTRFDPVEGELLKFFADEKGLSDSDTIRRSVRLLLREIEKRGPNWDWVGETARPMDGAALIKLKNAAFSNQAMKRVLDKAEEVQRSAGGVRAVASKTRKVS